MKEKMSSKTLRQALKLSCQQLVDSCALPEFTQNYTQTEMQQYKEDCVEHAIESFLDFAKFEEFKEKEMNRIEVMEEKRQRIQSIREKRQELRDQRRQKGENLIERSSERTKDRKANLN